MQSDGLRKHMVAYARQQGGDEEAYAVTGLLHDFDWEIHPTKGEAILQERGVSGEIRRAILSLADFTGVRPDSLLEKTLLACDGLSGFLLPCSYVKPSRSIHDVDGKSLRKKLKARPSREP